jgi:hypothetical protein
MVKKHLGPKALKAVETAAMADFHISPAVVPQTALPGSTEVPKKVKPSPKFGPVPSVKEAKAKVRAMEKAQAAEIKVPAAKAKKAKVAFEKEEKDVAKAEAKEAKAMKKMKNILLKQEERVSKQHKKAVAKHHAKEAKSEAKLVKEAMKHAKHEDKQTAKAAAMAAHDVHGVSAAQMRQHLAAFKKVKEAEIKQEIQKERKEIQEKKHEEMAGLKKMTAELKTDLAKKMRELRALAAEARSDLIHSKKGGSSDSLLSLQAKLEAAGLKP